MKEITVYKGFTIRRDPKKSVADIYDKQGQRIFTTLTLEKAKRFIDWETASEKSPYMIRRNPVGALKPFYTRDQFIDLMQQAFRSGRISLEDGWAILNRLEKERSRTRSAKVIPFPKRNPPGATRIYGRVISIVASKAGIKHKCDAKCKAANHVYRHVHIKKSDLWGLPDGRLMIAEAK